MPSKGKIKGFRSELDGGANLLFVIYDLERGGPEMRLLDFAKHFPEDLKIYICVTSKNLALLKEFQKYNVNIKVVPIAKFYLEINKVKDIYKYIQNNQISINNSFDLKGLIISVYIKIFGNKQLKVVHHTVDLLHNYKLRHKIMLWILLKFSDVCICNSMESKKILKNKYINEEKIHVIYNGVDTSFFKRNSHQNCHLKKELQIQENEIVLGTVANFRKEKNYPFLLNAFRILLNKYTNLRLLCVGGGKYLEEMRGIAKEYGLKNKVIFTGYSEHVVDYLNIMDIFILCSVQEGFPNSIIQAMSMEIPVISSSVGGCTEIIENSENGLLFKSNNLEEFINGVGRLIEDKKYAAHLADNAKIKIDKEFSLKDMIENYSKFYRSL